MARSDQPPLSASDPVATELEENACRSFARWDATLWRAVLAGPATTLRRGLIAKDGDDDRARAVTKMYLSLAAEGIGRGYLFPADAVGRDTFFTLTFLTLIPAQLPTLAPARQLAVLAACFNLGENLEASPPWLRHIFHRATTRLASLDEIEMLVSTVERQALAPPARTLTTPVTASWIWLGDEDRRMLPGAMHFLAPTVLCVHDRHRGGGAGRLPATCGVWLVDPPLLLGSVGCDEDLGPEPPVLGRLWRSAYDGDRRFTRPFSTTVNDWRAAASLETSQFVLALLPR